MQPLDVALLERDSQVAQSLMFALSQAFTSVREVQGIHELRASIAKNRIRVAVVDLEAASISEVERLSREFPTVCIVCTHRLADDEMWAAVLNAGAADVCAPTDTQGIVRAALKNPVSNSAAA